MAEPCETSRSFCCTLRETDPAHFEVQGIPRGYSGMCEICGQPGHTRHHPGPVPSTGRWCDEHYERLSRRRPLGPYIILFVVCVGLLGYPTYLLVMHVIRLMQD